MNTNTLAQSQSTQNPTAFIICTDAITDWNRKVLNVQLIAKEFATLEEAQATLDRVKKSNPKAFIKTRVIH